MTSRVLVVEDEPQVRELLKKVIEGKGYQVDVAINGREALSRLAESGFDLVIADIFMPEKDGLEIFMHLKEVDTSISIIAMSGGDQLYLDCAKNLGADRVLSKPFALKELTTALDELLVK